MQQELRKNVDIEKINKATKKWNNINKKVAFHKRSLVSYSEELLKKSKEYNYNDKQL